MTIEILAQRLSAALALSGGFLVAVAVACWLTGGDGSNVIRSIHDVGGLILAALGVILVAFGAMLALVRAAE